MKRYSIISLLVAATLPLLAQAGESGGGNGQIHATLKEIAQKAVLNSPEVTSKWHNYRAADEEIGVARGGFMPRVDVTAGTGRERLKQPPANQANDYTRTGYVLSLNQMIFDGFATRNEVRRLDKARLVRYYELLDASESVALEAGRAYLDVLRYRYLVDLAEDNYVQHKATYEQLLRRTQSGVGRRVDLEQAGSRLALAEVNLATENANLHDVSARYQRLVGSLPPRVGFTPALAGSAFPAKPNAAVDTLFQKNPSLLAAIENIEAAQYDLYARRAAYSPRVDLRARTDSTDNYLGVTGDRRYDVAELVVSWNLFNGGADRARERQYMERRNLALDLREKACRDTRQTLLIAYNDVLRLREQTGQLALQVSLLEKTRDAYRDQYNVGQRTLLDLLDTENELLSARRAAINADTDLTLAYLRTYAGMGTLLEYLGLQRLDAEMPKRNELADVDATALCPNEPIMLSQTDRQALDARAMALLESNRQAPPGGVLSTVAANPAEADVASRVMAWAAAWSARDYKRYADFYAAGYSPEAGGDPSRLRAGTAETRDSLHVEIRDLKVRLLGNEHAVAEFRQIYRSGSAKESTLKTLELGKVAGKWLISREAGAPCAGAACTGGVK